MIASGPTTAIMHFDTAKTAGLRHEQVEHLAYHIARLLTGERTAESEWLHAGIRIECEPDMDQGEG